MGLSTSRPLLRRLQGFWTEWLGNTPSIAIRYYLMTTDEYFAKAVAGDQAAHNAAQHVRARGRRESQATLPAQKKTPLLPGSAASCGLLPQCKVEDRGLEPLTFWLPARRSPN